MKWWCLAVAGFGLAAAFYLATVAHGTEPWWCAAAFGLAPGTLITAALTRRTR
jgi:hypothetical protein